MIWCSPPFIGFIPSPLLLVVEQPLANAKATASPKQRLILVRRLCFVFITVSFFLLIEFLFVVAANDMFANSQDYLLRQGTEKPSGAAVALVATCAGISCGN